MNNLRHYLETQSDRTEALLAAHHAPARITGGTVGPRLIRLFLAHPFRYHPRADG